MTQVDQEFWRIVAVSYTQAEIDLLRRWTCTMVVLAERAWSR